MSAGQLQQERKAAMVEQLQQKLAEKVQRHTRSCREGFEDRAGGRVSEEERDIERDGEIEMEINR